jgi:Tol biopolymer transport system component
LAALVAGALVGGYLLGRNGEEVGAPTEEPRFTQLSFDYGTVRAARFGPDGQTVVYGAAWKGEPIRLFLTRIDSADSTPLNLPDAELLSVSSNGELAVSLGHRFSGWMGAGTLARVPLLGGGPRSILEGVREADWAPDGSDLAVVRRVGGRERLEYPIGTVLVETTGYISHVRFSPDGERIAFADHPLWADDMGSVAIIDLAGQKTTQSGPWPSLRGLAWTPSGQEIWFTAFGDMGSALRAVDLSGHERVVLSGLSNLLLLDVSSEGRVLLGRETSLRRVEALVAGQDRPADFSLRSRSLGRYMSSDGRSMILSDQNAAGYSVFLQRVDGSSPVLLGEGDGYNLSDDGKWVLALTPNAVPRILIHPTGPGESRELPNPDGILADNARWLPGGKIVVLGPTASEGSRGYLFDPAGDPPRPFTPEGVVAEIPGPASIPASPDGTRIVARDAGGAFLIYPDGGDPEPIPGLEESDIPIEWADDGRALYVGRQEGVTWRISRLDLATGEATDWMEIVPTEPAGMRLSLVYITPNGQYWLHSSSRLLTDLFVAEGLK